MQVTETAYAEDAESPRQEHRRRPIVRRSVTRGALGGMALVALYFLVLGLANSLDHATEELARIWYWVAALVLGFGTQVGLYSYIRGGMKLRAEGGSAASSVAVAGGMSTTSMVACCAHHLTDVLPVLGVSAAAIFLNRFQDVFMTVGVLSNLIGINVMLKIIQKHGLYRTDGGALRALMRLDMGKSLYVVGALSGAALAATIYVRL